MKKNLLLIVENGFAWAGVITTFAMAILPLVQVLAGIAAFVFSILSISKIIKNWNEKDI
jgi:ABC-type phosphate/phosphonate transport system permease subunit